MKKQQDVRNPQSSILIHKSFEAFWDDYQNAFPLLEKEEVEKVFNTIEALCVANLLKTLSEEQQAKAISIAKRAMELNTPEALICLEQVLQYI